MSCGARRVQTRKWLGARPWKNQKEQPQDTTRRCRSQTEDRPAK